MLGKDLLYTDLKGFEKWGIVTSFNDSVDTINDRWVYQVDNNIYVDYSEVKEKYTQVK
jgi:hypothetical protein